MKVTITNNAKQQFLKVLGDEPVIRINEHQTTG